MNQDDGSGRKSEGRGFGPSYLWWALAAGLAALAVVFFLFNAAVEQIEYPTLMRLIEESKRDVNGEFEQGKEGWIEVDLPGKTRRKVRYSNLKKVQLDART